MPLIGFASGWVDCEFWGSHGVLIGARIVSELHCLRSQAWSKWRVGLDFDSGVEIDASGDIKVLSVL